MSHLNEKLAEVVFGELSTVDMAAAEQRLAECSDCRRQVDAFRHTHAMLKTSPDVEPPRRLVFEQPRPKFAPWAWRWLGPMTASAAVALAVVNLAPRPQSPGPMVVQQQAPTEPAVQPVDYQKIISELRSSQQIWLEGELNRRSVEQIQEIKRLRGELDLLDSYQRSAERDTIENSSSIQRLVAQRTEGRD